MISEGPQINFRNGFKIGYHHGTKAFRLINPERKVLLTYPFVMEENAWYKLKLVVNGTGIKFYLDKHQIISSDDIRVESGPIEIGGYYDGEEGLFDYVIIYRSEYIVIENVSRVQKFELYDSSERMRAYEEIEVGQEMLFLNVSDLEFPFKGFFKIYTIDGKVYRYPHSGVVEIWGGDVYLIEDMIEHQK